MEIKDVLVQLDKCGIDTALGIGYSGDEEIFIEILKVAYEGARDKIKKITDSFEKRNFEDYKILVHSVKSSALNLGATAVSEMAKKLESAGINHDYEYIEKNHRSFLDEYQILMERIGDVIMLQDITNPSKSDMVFCDEELTGEQVQQKAETIMLYLNELELDEAEIVGRDMLRYNINDDMRVNILEFINCLEHFDVEGAKQKICRLAL